MAEPEKPETLAESFAQARRELWFMLGTWVVFAAWVTIACSTMGRAPAEGETISTILGMPRWVFYGVGLPWALATATAVFFGAKVMKDTDLEGGNAGGEATDS
ncbi:MAG: DUF997 family protein [Verrucomicrobiales bacterium]|nr:DUF997 family protein [Verrucomicrobiales bacterium]